MNTTFRVDDQQHQVTAVDGILSALDTEEFNGSVDAAFLSNPGRIDQNTTLPSSFGFPRERNINGITRRARDGSDNDPVGFREGVDQR